MVKASAARGHANGFSCELAESRTAHPTIDPAGRAVRRSHDSRDDDERFMLRLNRLASRKLQALAEHFATSRAEIIRQLIAQASPEDVPESWQMAVEERRQPEARRADHINP
jgi:hypothetical protein